MEILNFPKPDEIDDDFWIALSSFIDKTMSKYRWARLLYINHQSEFYLAARDILFNENRYWIRHNPTRPENNLKQNPNDWEAFPKGTFYQIDKHSNIKILGNILTLK